MFACNKERQRNVELIAVTVKVLEQSVVLKFSLYS
jgi:hypothetical protein